MKNVLVAIMFSGCAHSASAQIPVYGDVKTVAAEVEAVIQAVKATEAATNYMIWLFGVSPSRIGAATMHTTAVTAVVTASTMTQTCELQLTKNATVDPYGWVVQRHWCKNR